MVFSSVTFILYFLPILLIGYYLIDRKYKNVFLLIISIIFYSWGAPKFIFVILGTTFIDFHLVRWMDNMATNRYRRLLLIISVSMNFGLLFYFKYSNFFIENLNSFLVLFGINSIHWTKLILPIGISFYTFETITYVVDVFRRVHAPLKNFWDYQLYIILFPKLIAGPIIRYHEISDQISDRRVNENNENRVNGFYRFVIGLAKKVLIANTVGAVADSVFNGSLVDLNTYQAWIGIIAYTFQIYFDFSGYSDMAIGLGKMLGFKFPENFDNPYISRSITEFWRRWHITLGSWMRNYLYIPLGGNRVSNKFRLYFNLWLVFLASGLWHGASWSFIIWGAFHGLFLVLERMFLLNVYNKIGKFLSTIVTFLIVVVGWVFFRIENLSDALFVLRKMFSFDFEGYAYYDFKFYVILILSVFFAFFTFFEKGLKIEQIVYYGNNSNIRHITLSVIVLLLLLLSLGSITASEFNPFIYFRF